ncbi:MAG: helix-turn-helix domain-containing protein, partial [Akkermansiaceae bacterium]|nr:helix-turn-helix domain-containing protein [Akkermansiaceae bacterium]
QPITIGSYQPAELSHPPAPPEPLLTESEVCDFLRIRPRQLFAWRRDGLIPYIKIGKALRFRLSDIERAPEGMTIGGRG